MPVCSYTLPSFPSGKGLPFPLPLLWKSPPETRSLDSNLKLMLRLLDMVHTPSGCNFHWDDTGLRFSLKRYGVEVSSETARGWSFHCNVTGWNFAETVRGWSFHWNGTGLNFSLQGYGVEIVTETGLEISLRKYGVEVFTETVRGWSFHWNETGLKFSLKRYGI